MDHRIEISASEGTGYDSELLVVCSCGAYLVEGRSMEHDGPLGFDVLAALAAEHRAAALVAAGVPAEVAEQIREASTLVYGG